MNIGPSSSAKPGAPPGNGDFYPTGTSLYEHQQRPRRDLCMCITFATLLSATMVWAIAAFAKSDPHYRDYTIDFYNRSQSCSLPAFKKANLNNPVQPTELVNDDTSLNAFMKGISIWLPLTVAIGVVSSVTYVLLFRQFAMAMVYITVIASLIVSYVIAIAALATGGIPAGIILLIFAVILTAMYWWIRADFQTCARLLTVAGRGLHENPWLVTYTLGVKFVGAGFLAYMCAGFFYALNVGQVEHAPRTTYNGTGDADLNGFCTMTSLDGGTPTIVVVPCCEWRNPGWAVAFMVFDFFMLSWLAFFIFELKLYLVADTIAQWYFMPSGGYAGDSRPSVNRALRNGMTSSFGSLAFASLILTLIDMIRSALRRSARDNVWMCIINCIAQPILALCEQFTKFATIAVAITGKGFVESSRQIYGTLSRCFLSTYNLWWIPEMVLSMAMFLFSLTWFAIVFFATWLQTHGKDSGVRIGVSFAVGAVCWCFMGFLLGFVSSMLLDIVNTIYICFALDRDRHHVTKPEIHQIYMEVPSVKGAVIANPDGNVVYGAPVPDMSASQGQPMYGGYQSSSQPMYGQPAYVQQQGLQQAPYGYGHNNV